MSNLSSEQLSSWEQGHEVIKSYAENLPSSAGVYRMISSNGDVLYVGKAKALKRRVLSYTQFNRLPVRLRRMVSLTRRMEFVQTHTEAEALLLEANLIKTLKPRFNILLRDDKSFPYIHVRENHDFPIVEKFRGKRQKDGLYFGPFASAGDVNKTLKTLQRVFMLRNCSDYNFSNRKRPCLQYHIKRCTAPCVGYVSKDEYNQQVGEAREFLSGKSSALQDRYRKNMEAASHDLNYEQAANYRDRLKVLMSVLARQDVNLTHLGEADVFAVVKQGERACVQIFFFRAGQNYGNHAFFPKFEGDIDEAMILETAIAQFYISRPAPKSILTSHECAGLINIAQSLSSVSGHKVQIVAPLRGDKRKAVDFALMNAKAALERKSLEQQSEKQHLQALADLFEMEKIPSRIEVYDNSHISGTNMVGGMIVAGEGGFQKNAYRKFNIREAGASDDYGMMREVMQRRFKNAQGGEFKPGQDDWPDVLLIDGGKGQLSAVCDVLEDIGVLSDLTVVAIAKGEDRNAGREKFHMPGRAEFTLPPNDSTLYYLQRIRDEAHRFAVSSHQVRRKKSMKDTSLDDVPGIGAKRKAALIRYFGSARAATEASAHDLQKVDGISQAKAKEIYEYFRHS